MSERRFADAMFIRGLLPSLSASVGLSFGNIADAVMVGSTLGETGLAVLNIASPIYLFFNIIDVGLGIGASVKYDKLLGEGRAAEAVDHFNLMLWAALLSSFAITLCGAFFLPEILTALGASSGAREMYTACAGYADILFKTAPLFFLNIYLYYMVRSDDAQHLASCGLLIGTLVDIAANYVFIFVLDMGINGAAWATVAGHAVSVAVYSAHILTRRRVLRFRFPGPDLLGAWRSFRTGAATSFQYMYQGLLWVAVNHILMGTLGEAGAAVYGVVMNVSYVAMAFPEGLNGVLQPLASTFTGERNFSAVERVHELALRCVTFIGIPPLAVLFFFAAPVCEIFGLSEPESLRMGVGALRFYCAGAAFAGYSLITAFFFQAVGEEDLSSFISLLRNLLIPLPACWVMAALAPEYLWLMFPLSEAACVMIWKIAGWRGKWAGRKANASDPLRAYSRTIAGTAKDIGALVSEVAEFCDKWSADAQKKYHTVMAAEEVAALIIGRAAAPGRGMYVNISLIASEDGDFYLHVRDNADFFNPLAMDVRKVRSEKDENLSGLGVLIIKGVSKSVFYRRYRGFNTLAICI